MKNISEYFGCLVFDDRVMKANLSAKVYQSLKKTIDEGAQLDISVANAVAAAMKEWAVANGATHYTHWFQPLTGGTANHAVHRQYAHVGRRRDPCDPCPVCSRAHHMDLYDESGNGRQGLKDKQFRKSENEACFE